MRTGTIHLILLLVAILLTVGCAQSPYRYPRPGGAPIESRPSASPASRGVETAPLPDSGRPADETIQPHEESPAPASDAVESLIADAWQLYDEQQYQKAIAVAERAQRLNRRHAETYLVMGRSYFALYQMELAEQLARQGLAFAASGSAVRYQLESLLQQIGLPR